MKKLLLIAVAIFTVMAMSSCDEDNGAEMRSYAVELFTRDWLYWTDNNDWNGYLYQDVYFPEIDREVFEYGMVNVFIRYGDYQEPLPYHVWVDQGIGDEGIFDQGISYAYRPGWVRFYYNRSNFIYPDGQPDYMQFRVVIVYP